MSSLTAMPEAARAGATLEYSRTYSDYTAADGWSLKLVLAGPSVASDTASDAGGGAWTFSIPASTTASLLPGRYSWVERASRSGVVVDLESGYVTILQNLETAAAGDAQSAEEKQLAKVDAAIDYLLTGNLQSYQVAGRGLTRIPLPDLSDLKSRLQAAVNRQRNGGRIGRMHMLDFRRAGE